jgi:hypothetical protein
MEEVMVKRQSTMSHKNNPRRRVHKIGRHIEVVTRGGAVIERKVWDGSEWVTVSPRANMEYALLKEIFRLRSKVNALQKGKKG